MESAIRTTYRTGEVVIGLSSVKRDLLNGKLKAVIYSPSLPREAADELERLAKIAKIAIKRLEIDSRDLGGLCNKPFPVAAIGIRDFGQSDLERLVKK